MEENQRGGGLEKEKFGGSFFLTRIYNWLNLAIRSEPGRYKQEDSEQTVTGPHCDEVCATKKLRPLCNRQTHQTKSTGRPFICLFQGETESRPCCVPLDADVACKHCNKSVRRPSHLDDPEQSRGRRDGGGGG